MADVRALFEAKVDQSGEHHLWLGTRTERGAGQIRIAGKLRTAIQVAWELEHGEIPNDRRVKACPDTPLCVRASHLSLAAHRSSGSNSTTTRSERGSGSIRRIADNKWKLTIDAGRDDRGNRRRVTRVVEGTKAQASRALAALSVEVQTGERVPAQHGSAISVAELVDWYVSFARDVRGLERTTVFGYHEVFDVWLRPRIGHVLAERLTPAQIDEAFGQMRAGGKSNSRMNNARAALSGAYKSGRRHDKVRANPMRGFEIPKSTHVPRKTVAPEADELRFLLAEAQAFDPEFAAVLLLAATTGMRRGELSGLRRDRLRLARGELFVERSISEIDGVLEDKPTKTNQTRLVKLDQATIAFLRSHLAEMDERASTCGTAVPENGFVFSLDPACVVPMRPELMTRRMRRIRKHLGITKSDFDANILAMRKWTSTELMDAGFNPSAVSGRQGHTVQVMLTNYSSRRSSADQAAADHLGAQVFRTGDPR
ncbi:MAG: tyrosine-type recombinase/integrase [Actinomycetota bacterium]|nr:tyrosine-type recombinase/integrase [Actinomycetota bacterium]